MDCDFIIDGEEVETDRPALSGWETVVFELEDDPEYVRRSDSARGGVGATCT